MAKKKKGTKKSTQNIVHVIISIVYIIWGIYSPLSALNAIIALDVGALILSAVGIITLIAGIMGLFRLKPSVRRTLGIIIFVLSTVSVVLALTGGSIAWKSILQAILAWLYIIW
ncbi:MAG: hypothetical protein E7610_05610 [Ruminococcaceae bacterium]|nr:hypothetical protein [Oscillospiraceae bacterium]